MCTEMYKKMQTKRIYSEVLLRMRTSKVAVNSIGSEFLKYAVLACLHDSSLDIRGLTTEAIENVSFAIHGISRENFEGAIALMREALEPVNMKLDSDSTKAVESFIKTLAEQVKIAEMVNMRILSYDINANTHQTEVFIQTAIRRMRKPDHEFKEVLNWIAGKFDYDSVIGLLSDLDVIARSNCNSKTLIDNLKALLPKRSVETDDVFELLEETKSRQYQEEDKELITCIENAAVSEILYIVDVLLKEKDNLFF